MSLPRTEQDRQKDRQPWRARDRSTARGSPASRAMTGCRAAASCAEGLDHVVRKRCVEIIRHFEQAAVAAKGSLRPALYRNQPRDGLAAAGDGDLLTSGDSAEQGREGCLGLVYTNLDLHTDRVD